MSVRAFYDALAPRYHLAYADWNASIARQGRALDELITEHLGDGKHVVDVAVGIGTQALGLASRDYRVIGSDLSPAAVSRASAEAGTRPPQPDVPVAGFWQPPLPPPRPNP